MVLTWICVVRCGGGTFGCVAPLHTATTAGGVHWTSEPARGVDAARNGAFHGSRSARGCSNWQCTRISCIAYEPPGNFEITTPRASTTTSSVPTSIENYSTSLRFPVQGRRAAGIDPLTGPLATFEGFLLSFTSSIVLSRFYVDFYLDFSLHFYLHFYLVVSRRWFLRILRVYDMEFLIENAGSGYDIIVVGGEVYFRVF